MLKKVLALSLVLLLAVGILAGCGTTATPNEPATGGDNEPTPGGGGNEEPPVELIWIMGDPGQIPPDQAAVEAKLNEISLRELNVTVKTLYYDNERAMLALSTGEQYDMVFTCGWYNDFSTQAHNGYFADITDKVQSMTPALYETMPEMVWEGAKINGQIMAIPVKKDYAAEMFWRFDTELFVNELGMEVNDSMGFHDLEPFLKAAKDAYNEGVEAAADARYPFMLNRAGLNGVDSDYDMINRDAMLGIPYSAVGTADNNKIVVTVEHPDMFNILTSLYNWNQAGYINPDAATIDDIGSYSAVKNGQGFYGADAIWTSGDGYHQVISKYSGPFLSTASIRGSMNAISANSQHIDLALKYQELVNTNQEYRNILRYGIEGEHWNMNDENLVVRTQKGRDGYNPWPFSQGSYSLSSVEAAEGVDVDPNMWDVIFEGYEDLVATNTIGFSFDISSVEAQIASINVIRDKYWVGLLTGTTNPAVEVPKMIAELEAAGLRDVQAEAQRQFDEFLAQN